MDQRLESVVRGPPRVRECLFVPCQCKLGKRFIKYFQYFKSMFVWSLETPGKF